MSQTGSGDGQFPNIPLPGLGIPTEPERPTPTSGPVRATLPTESTSGAGLPSMLDAERSSSAWKSTAFSFVTGRAGGAFDGDSRAQLIAAFGASERDPARPDVKAAAKALKVSPRSVQRWIAGGGISPRHAKTLRTKARQAMTTRRGRERAVRSMGALQAPRGKNAIRIGGIQGVTTGDTGNYRPRETKVQVSAFDLERLQQLWVDHGEAGAEAWLHAHFDQHYQSGWHFQSISDITWDTSTNY